jgi:hypothetical protein
VAIVRIVEATRTHTASAAAGLLEILVHFEIDIQNLPVRYRFVEESKRPTT